MKRGEKKGDNGIVLIVAGSLDYVGAAALCSVATLRMGADLVYLAAPKKVALAVNALNPDIITLKLSGNHIKKGHLKKIKHLMEKSDVALIGPGLGTKKSTTIFVNKFIENYHKPKVIDADAIKAVNLQHCHNSILTPHAGELRILLENSGYETLQQDKVWDNVILLKGPTDEIISKTKKKKVKGGSNSMTVGGTGDVLAGIAAGYLSQKYDLFESAYKASQLMKKVGKKLDKQLGHGLIASDFLKEIAVGNK